MVTDSTSQADETTAFLRAARSGNLEKVVEFLDTDLDINTANTNGLNALHLSSKDGHVEIVTELLRRGAKVDAATKKGNTALHIASLAGQVDIVNILIQYGAAVNIQSQNGFTPLYMAAQENHDQVVKLLLNNGANQSLATEDGFTPLAVAMQQGHDKVVSVLLENDSKGKVRLPALHIAAKKDDCKAADLLLQNDHKPDVTSKSGFTPLHIAAHYGNEEIARLLIKRGADVNYLAKHNISPLHVAAKWGKNNMVKVLLENSAQIDAKTRDGLTPLHCAARSGHEQVITTLLEHSAPISARTKNGLAPLHMASQGDHVDAARVLLYHRAPVDEVTIDYLTSLHVAAHCGHVRVAKLLLDRKADPNARALNGFTPLHIACKKNRIKVVELLLKHGASIESTTESGLTPLHVASFMGCMNIVIFLLQHEANPDVPTVRGETPLHLAARANQTDIIRILLRNGAKVDARAREQQTPLHIASRLGNIDIVMLLLQHGAAVDTATKDMYTALHIAAKEGQEEVAAILVENNASVRATTKNGFTPLHIAAKYGNMSVAKILLQKDSKLDAQGKNDISSLHLACHYDHPNVANLLLEEGASPHLASQNGHTPLHIAARKNQMDIASTLLENGANANMESKAGFTPLHFSAQKGHYDMTNLLIEHGADPNHKSKNGLTAMHLCAQEDFIKVASILVKNGADVESQTETGYRPVHVAAHFGNLSVIRFLLKQNANINVVTDQNYSPLHQAAQQGHAHIVSALLEANASHKARTSDGLTALNIAQKLGYISVMEVLKGLPDDGLALDNKSWDEKYKVIAPESLQETSFMSDSDEEGGSDALISEQPYRYLTADLMKSLRDDSLPIDVTRDDPVHRPVTKEEKQEFIQSNNYCLAESFDNDGFNFGFLVSFLVDARGGALKGCRHSGVRIIIPPRRATMPIRVTCRLIKSSKVTNPPPLMEGEALATRIIEMGPVGATFLGPVLIDIPHFASVRGKEREIIILRSENGEAWKEHDNYVDNDTSLLNTSYDTQMNAAYSGRITRIITTDFPQYFAIVTRIRQEVHVIGAEGGILTSSVAGDVQAVFPPGALTKKIKVGLQAHVISAEVTAKLLGNCVAVSPVITIEPRRRKFHKPITLTIPVPQAANKGMINQYGGETPTLRLLCSIAGGTNESQWEDVTGSTPLTFVNGTVSFTTTVSARFWLMDCRNIGAIAKMATALYEESLFVPYITNFIIYSKRMDVLEATLKILCMTDGKEGMHTLEKQEEFVEIVKSRDVETLDGKNLYIEFSGNLVPVTKSGVQLKFTFKAFHQNRLSFHVKVKDPLLDPVARMLFMREPKVAKGEPPQQPICVLNIVLPEITTKIETRKILKGYQDSNIISQKLASYETICKTEQSEKRDESKDTTPWEKKFIADTLQKERTDAAITKESLVQKAACSLESVDASYPSNIVGPELSPSVERQTYSEKRKFWEDISKKRESYQRSESEVSGTSQLTINESDSEYVQQVLTTDTAEIAQQMEKSGTMEDLNVPDISECSVAEKAQYFEEQIQKETTKLAVKLTQQDPVKGTKVKGEDREDAEKCAKYMIEAKDAVREDDIKRSKQLFLKEEKEEGLEGVENEEQQLVYSDRSKAVSIEATDSNLPAIESSKVVYHDRTVGETAKKVPVDVERPVKDDAESYGAVAPVESMDVEVTPAKSMEEKLKVEEYRTEAAESVPSFDPILVHKAKETEVNVVEIPEIGLALERVSDSADKVSVTDRERSTDVQEKLEDVAKIREGAKEPITVDESGKETAAERDICEETDMVQRDVTSGSNGAIAKERDEYEAKTSTPALVIEKEEGGRTSSVVGQTEVEVVPDEKLSERDSGDSTAQDGGEVEENRESSVQTDKVPECIETVTEVTAKATISDARIAEETRESVQVVAERQRIVEDVADVASREEEKISVTEKEEKILVIEKEEKISVIEKDEREGKEKASKIVPDAEQKVEEEALEEPVTTCIEELVDDESRFSRKDVVSSKVQAAPEAKSVEEVGVVGEKPGGRRVITEETTIIYKVQKDGTLVQEQVLKSVQVEGESGDGFGDLTQIYDARTIGEVKSETGSAVSIEREMEKFLQGERRLAEAKDETRDETISNGEEKSASLSELAAPMETDIAVVKKEETIEVERRFVRKDFESRIPISMTKLDKDRIHKEAKVKTVVETKVASKPEMEKESHTEAEDISPTERKRKIETRIPKRVIETKSDKPGKKDKKEEELCEEVRVKLEKQSLAKSETRKDDHRTEDLGAVVEKDRSISTAMGIIKSEDDVVPVAEPRPSDQRTRMEETFEKSPGASLELGDASATGRTKDDASGESDRVKDDVGTLAEEELPKDESLDPVKVVTIAESPDEAYLSKKDREPIAAVESLEERQRQKFKEIEARTIAEALVESIESEIEATAAAQLTSKSYLGQSIGESVATEKDEKLADDLARKFESATRKPGAGKAAEAPDSIASSRQMSMREDSRERDSTSTTVNDEDMIRDEESFQHEREESFPLSLSSSSQAKLQDRDITMSPSSISEQMDLEEVVDVDANEFEGVSSKPTFSLSSERQRSDKSNSQAELQDFVNGASLPPGKAVSENSGARVLEILEPDSHSREDSVDVPSLEMDEHKLSEQTSRGIPSLHESMGGEPFDRLGQERDITISPSTVSEDTNVDYSMMLEPSESAAGQRDQDVFSASKRADSFETASLDMISEKPKVRGLEIKPVDWMIGDEKIEISETLQPSQIFNQELDMYESMQKSERPSTLHGSITTDADRGGPVTTKRTKFVVIPVVEQSLDSNELAVEKSRTAEKSDEDLLPRTDHPSSEQRDSAVTTISDAGSIVAETASTQDRMKGETFEGVSSSEPEERKVEPEEGLLSKPDAESQLEKEPDESVKESGTVIPDSDKAAPVDDVLKGWTETCSSKMEPSNEDYRRHVEKATDKNDKSGVSATVPSDICAFKRKKDEPLPDVELSARYAITVLDQVVKKKIAEVKESLEAAKQDLIEELSENSETMIQIKDSPSEFQFKLQIESISNDLPFPYTSPPVLDEALASASVKPTDDDASLGESSAPGEAQRDAAEAETDAGEVASFGTEGSALPETTDGEEELAALKEAEEFSEDTAAITVQDDAKDAEDEHPSPLPASMSGSDVDNKDESSSLALPPRPMLKRRQKPGKSSKRVASESDADLGSSSGESSNYLSCDYEIGSGSRPSSSDIEAMQSCGVLSATTSEYETAVMSVEHSSTSKPTSQDYYTAATTMSSRESMKSLASLSSGHLGSIDSTSELSETLVPSEPEADNEEVDEKLNGALDDEHTERTDSSGSDMFPIDESIDKIGSRISCGMKRSSEMIFPQVLDSAGLDVDAPPVQHAAGQIDKAVDSATSASMTVPLGVLRSVDIMTSRVAVDGVRSVCTQVISTSADGKEDVTVGASTVPITEDLASDVATTMGQRKIEESTLPDVRGIESSSTSEHRPEPPDAAASIDGQAAETPIQSSTEPARTTDASSTSGVAIVDAASIGKEKSRERHSPDSDSFEMIDKPDIIDDFIVIEEVGKEAVEYDSEGKGIRISVVAQLTTKQYDRDLENLINETKDAPAEAAAGQASKNPELFDFESEESPPQVSSEDQYSQSYLDDEQYGVGKKWLEMQFHADARVYDVEYDRGPLEDIKEEEITDFEPGSSRFGSLGSHKESIGSVGSMRGSFGSTPDYDILAGKKHFARPSEHDNVSLSSLQEFENLESAVAAENSRRLHCGSHDSVNNGSLPRRYMASRSGHGDDVSLSSLKDFEGLEKACREAHLIELRAREEEDLLEHESPENKYKLETLSRARAEAASTVGSFNASTEASGSDDYEKRIKEIDEIIRIAQTNVEKFDRQDDTAEDVSQIDVTDAEKTTGGQGTVAVGSTRKDEEPESVPPAQKETDVMETSTDSLELEDNMDKKRHPLCRSSDSLEMKTTLDFPSLSSDSLNNVRDAKDAQSDVAGHASGIRRISSDSLDIPLFEQQDADGQEVRSHGADHQSDCAGPATTLESLPPKRTESDAKRDKARTTSNADT